MNVFYNLADPHSRSAVFSPTVQHTGDRNAFTLAGGTVYTFPLSGNSVFFSSRLRYLMLNTGNSGYNSARSGFFALFNSDNKLMCTIGWHDTASSISKMVVRAYDDAGAVTKTTLIPHTLPLNADTSYASRLFTFYVGLEPSTGRKRLTLHYFGGTFGEIYDDAVTSVTNLTIGKLTMNPVTISSYSTPVLADIVITDTENYALESVVVKPAALAAGNQFTGVIGSLRTWTQDRAYISNSSEVNVTASFTISYPNSDIGYYTAISNSSIIKPSIMIDQLYDVIQYDQYFMGRYVQDGGSSVTFTGYMKNSSDNDLVSSHTVNIPANQDDTTYLVKLASKQPVNLKLSAILASTVKYVLTGV